MTRLRSLVLLFFLPVLLSGCFFDNPLTSTATKELNTWLLGVWEHKDDKGQLYRTTVTPLSENHYNVWFRIVGSTPAQTKEWYFDAWISRVGHSAYLNFHCLKSAGQIPQGAFVFAHYQVVDQNDVVIRSLQIDAAQSATSFQLRDQIRRQEKAKTLYSDAGTIWHRVSEVYWQVGGDGNQPFQPLRYPEDN